MQPFQKLQSHNWHAASSERAARSRNRPVNAGLNSRLTERIHRLNRSLIANVTNASTSMNDCRCLSKNTMCWSTINASLKPKHWQKRLGNSRPTTPLCGNCWHKAEWFVAWMRNDRSRKKRMLALSTLPKMPSVRASRLSARLSFLPQKTGKNLQKTAHNGLPKADPAQLLPKHSSREK